jgi:hypothetical protein
MRTKKAFFLTLAFLSFLLILFSFRSGTGNNTLVQDDKKKKYEPKKAAQDQKAIAKDSLIGVHPYYLEMRGLVRQTQVDANSTTKGALIDSAQIKVFADSTRLVAIHYSSKHGECRFKLPLMRRLRLEISKPGFVSKLIDVDSKVPPERKMVYIFPFDIDLFEEIPDLDVRALKHPIAKVKFEMEKGNFEYDEIFTNAVNRDLKVLYKSYREKMNPDGSGPKK